MRWAYFILAIPIIFCDSFALAFSAIPAFAQITNHEQNSHLEQIDEKLEIELKNVATSAHHLQKTIHDIIFEITRQEYVRSSEPEVAGPIVIPAIPPPDGVIAMSGFLPARKKYIDFFAEQARNLLMMLNEEGMSLPDSWEADSQVSAQLISVKTILNDLRIQNNALLTSMTGSNYDNLVIGKQAIKMSEDLDQVQELLKECEKLVHKDIKQIKE